MLETDPTETVASGKRERCLTRAGSQLEAVNLPAGPFDWTVGLPFGRASWQLWRLILTDERQIDISIAQLACQPSGGAAAGLQWVPNRWNWTQGASWRPMHKERPASAKGGADLGLILAMFGAKRADIGHLVGGPFGWRRQGREKVAAGQEGE